MTYLLSMRHARDKQPGREMHSDLLSPSSIILACTSMLTYQTLKNFVHDSQYEGQENNILIEYRDAYIGSKWQLSFFQIIAFKGGKFDIIFRIFVSSTAVLHFCLNFGSAGDYGKKCRDCFSPGIVALEIYITT